MSTLPKKSSPEDPCGHRLYEKQYKDAEALFEEGRMDETVKKAKHNLTDPTIPPYYHMKNCILIASAMTDWNDADIYVLSAKQQYAKSLALAKRLDNQPGLDVLEEIGKELEQLGQFRKEDIADTGIIEDSDFFPTEEDYEEFEGP